MPFALPAQLPGEQTGSLAHWMEQGCLHCTKETGKGITIYNLSEVMTQKHLYSCSWEPSLQALQSREILTHSLSEDWAPSLGFCTFSSRVSCKSLTDMSKLWWRKEFKVPKQIQDCSFLVRQLKQKNVHSQRPSLLFKNRFFQATWNI